MSLFWNTRTALARVSALGFTLALAACKTDPATRKAESMDNNVSSPGLRTQAEPQNSGSALTGPTGSIAGTILFGGKVPATTIDTSMDPACAMGGGSDRLPVEQYAAKDGKLANVFLYVKSGPPAAMQAGSRSNQPVIMDQQHCRYVPHVIGVMVAGTVEFRNSDLTMHNIHTLPTSVGNETIDISQGPRGTPVRKQFSKPELMMPVRCNNHPWMNAFINVSATPYFAVSDAAGHFEITGLPPGEYVLGAVQEKLGEQTLQVTVQPNLAAKAQFTYAAAR